MPNVWKWAQTMQAALLKQKSLNQPLLPKPGVDLAVLEDICTEAALKLHFGRSQTATVSVSGEGDDDGGENVGQHVIQGMTVFGARTDASKHQINAQLALLYSNAPPPTFNGSMHIGNLLQVAASPLSPRHLRGRTPLKSNGVRWDDPCSPLAACAQLNACGCSRLCRCKAGDPVLRKLAFDDDDGADGNESPTLLEGKQVHQRASAPAAPVSTPEVAQRIEREAKAEYDRCKEEAQKIQEDLARREANPHNTYMRQHEDRTSKAKAGKTQLNAARDSFLLEIENRKARNALRVKEAEEIGTEQDLLQDKLNQLRATEMVVAIGKVRTSDLDGLAAEAAAQAKIDALEVKRKDLKLKKEELPKGELLEAVEARLHHNSSISRTGQSTRFNRLPPPYNYDWRVVPKIEA
jgi:hypothetical protein